MGGARWCTGWHLQGRFLIIIAVVHSWLGERQIIGPVLAFPYDSGPIAESRRIKPILRGAWHFTSITWVGHGAILIALAFAPLGVAVATVAWVSAALYGAIGVYLLVTFKGRHVAAPLFIAVAISAAIPFI